jgi:Ca2+-binding RTX toxin-like protein
MSSAQSRSHRYGLQSGIIEPMEPRLLLTSSLTWTLPIGQTGGNDWAHGLAVDASGAAYLVGETPSTGFHTAGMTPHQGHHDGFLAKLNRDRSIAWFTYIGGQYFDEATAVTVDPDGNIIVVGYTGSAEGWLPHYSEYATSFVAKFQPDGTRLWIRSLGEDYTHPRGVAADASGNIFVITDTFDDLAITGGADLTRNGSSDALLFKLTSAGATLWGTYIGGSNYDYAAGVAVDKSGNAFVVGKTSSSGWARNGYDTSFGGITDGFVTKVTAAGAIAWSSYLGSVMEDEAKGVTTDAAGNVYITGWTDTSVTAAKSWVSGGFDALKNNGIDGFLVKLSPTGTRLWSAYLGGVDGTTWQNRPAEGYAVTVDPAGNAYVTGETWNSNFGRRGFDSKYGGKGDAFIMKVTSTGTLGWSSYLGGAGEEIGKSVQFCADGYLYVSGQKSSDYLLDGMIDLFVSRISARAPVSISGTSSADTISVNMVNGKIRVTKNGRNSYYGTWQVSSLTLSGSGGNDRLSIGAGVRAVTLKGGDGNDVLTGGDGNDLLDGGNGNDVLRGGGGNDRLYGRSGADKLYGGAGNDRLEGGTGTDSLYGDAGDDQFYAIDAALDYLTGGDGSDTAHRETKDRLLDQFESVLKT